MSAHDPTHDDVLRDILAGDLDESAPAARELIDRCAECRERLAELRALADELDAAGESARAAIAAEGDAPGLDRVAAVIGAAPLPGAALAGAPSERATRRGWIAALFIAAGVGILAAAAWAIFGGGGDDEDDDPDTMLGVPIEALAPVGTVDGFGEFRWGGERSSGEHYIVTVRVPGAAPEDPPLARSAEIRESRWAPVEEAERRLPQEIEWQVRLYDSKGDEVGASPWTTAKRRRS